MGRDSYKVVQSRKASPQVRSTLAELLRLKSTCGIDSSFDPPQDLDRFSGSLNADSVGMVSAGLSPEKEPDGMAVSHSFLIANNDLIHIQEEESRSPLASEDSISSCNSLSMHIDDKTEPYAVLSHSKIQLEENDLPFSSLNQMGELKIDDELTDYAHQAREAAANLINRAHKEINLRRRAEREALEAFNRAKILETSLTEEVKQREKVEALLAQQKMEMEDLQKDFNKAKEQKLELEAKIKESKCRVQGLEDKLLEAQSLFFSVKERGRLQKNADNTDTELQEIQQKTKEPRLSMSFEFSEFSFTEIQQATCNFEPLLKIGEWGLGYVYKGFMRHSAVSIKVIHPHRLPGLINIHKEIEHLGRLRHPNIVSLLGVCYQEQALIYEFLPNTSLEDHLTGKSGNQPLPWQKRARIIAEICSALIFLHSCKTREVIHGDLRPANILINYNLVSKVTDFGISCQLVQSGSPFQNQIDPSETNAHMDPEFVTTRRLTACSDVYSFGIIILRLLTGRPALGIVREVHDAVEKGTMQTAIDSTAGNWPPVLVQELANLALGCCEMKHENRPDLVGDAWKILEPWLHSEPAATPAGRNPPSSNGSTFFCDGMEVEVV